MTLRPSQPEGFLRGCAFAGTAGVPYPRADPADVSRLPADTWGCAQIPASVRLELVGDARSIEISYRAESDGLGSWRGEPWRSFSLWRDGQLVDQAAVAPGEGLVALSTGSSDPSSVATVYLPEAVRPTVLSIDAAGGSIEPAPRGPRWIAYGDSIAEGWIASSPARAWPAEAARRLGLDLVNLGYAGAARGEVVSAEQIAKLPADAISISHGTNCWTRVPFSRGMLSEGTKAFLDIVRQGHPATPIVVASPVVRPDAEEVPNRLGATLADLREAMEEAVEERIASGDSRLRLLKGRNLVPDRQLGDGIHPNDEGHGTLANVIGHAVTSSLSA